LNQFAGAAYVEGFAVNRHRLVFEHAWIEHEGAILDPTLPEDDLVYFPGLRFVGRDELIQANALPETDQVAIGIGADGTVSIVPVARSSRRDSASRDDSREHRKRGPRLPIFFRFGFGGYDHPEFRAAREAAMRYAGHA
jgi:hypothetical protein